MTNKKEMSQSDWTYLVLGVAMLFGLLVRFLPGLMAGFPLNDGGMFLSMTSAVHGDLSANAPAWAPAPLTDQRLGILILWIGGNVIFLAALIMLIAGWMQYEKRHQERVDRKLRLEAEAKARRRAALDQVFRKGV